MRKKRGRSMPDDTGTQDLPPTTKTTSKLIPATSKRTKGSHQLPTVNKPVTQPQQRRPLRMTAAQALAKLQDILDIESGSESSDSVSDCEVRAASDSDEDIEPCQENDESSTDDSDNETNLVAKNGLNENNGEESTSLIAKDGTQWRVTPQCEGRGRMQSQNVFSAKPGVTAYCRNITTPVDAFRLIIDQGFVRHIQKCTVDYARISEPLFDVTEDELEAFIGLLYLRGFMSAKNFPMHLMWSKMYGCAAFNQTMSRNRYEQIKKYIRFDVRATRQERVKNDKFCLLSWVLARFNDNSQKCYIPEESLTIDEQLYPTKARCRFTQYMPNKPDKFGIKFWVLAELSSKYCLNIKPYTGKDDERMDSLGTHVVMSLMQPYFQRGYNVTTDNFFTSRDLAEKLLQKRTSLVGTIRMNRREIPPSTSLKMHESVFYTSGSLNLVKYQAKPHKTVAILSTLHKGASCQTDGKRKPESILYYNSNKCGVDMLDSMCRQMSTKAATRRWTLSVFFNILDMAGINAWIIFNKKTGNTMSRRQFLHKLSEELRQTLVGQSTCQSIPPEMMQRKLAKRVTCEVKVNCKRNRTVTMCEKCKNPVCGQCLSNICIGCK